MGLPFFFISGVFQMPYIASTLAAPVQYTHYKQGANDLPQVAGSVLIQGGAGVANKHLITPQGVLTKVSTEEAELLHKIPLFLTHKERGFIKVLEDKAEPDTVAADMERGDTSAQLTPGDFKMPPVPTRKGR